MAVSEPDTDAGAHGYERQLDDAELVALGTDVSRRVQALLAQGVPLPMSQMENHHLVGLLEVMVGPARANRVREWHLVWVDRQLDAVEAQVRAHLLQSGIFDPNDPAEVPGFP